MISQSWLCISQWVGILFREKSSKSFIVRPFMRPLGAVKAVFTPLRCKFAGLCLFYQRADRPGSWALGSWCCCQGSCNFEGLFPYFGTIFTPGGGSGIELREFGVRHQWEDAWPHPVLGPVWLQGPVPCQDTNKGLWDSCCKNLPGVTSAGCWKSLRYFQNCWCWILQCVLSWEQLSFWIFSMKENYPGLEDLLWFFFRFLLVAAVHKDSKLGGILLSCSFCEVALIC